MRRLLVIGCCAVGMVAPASAQADGVPLGPMQGGAGVSALDGRSSYVAVGAGRATVVERVSGRGGAVERARRLPGRLGVASVGLDGSATGLSGNGRTLVLQGLSRRYPPRTTRLVVLRARRLRPAGEVRLRGSFALDAVSPGGRRLYLVHDLSARGALRYEVRAYDLAHRRLLPQPVVDPREPGEKMLGVAVTRTTSADGRWAYTFYQRPGESPFVHALDARAGAAFCVDLPSLDDGDVSTVRLRLAHGERTLRVETPAGVQALVDTRTFAVRPPATTRPAPLLRPARSGGGAIPWGPIAALTAAAAALFGVLALRRRRAAPSAPA
jgi:hypothetical protein